MIPGRKRGNHLFLILNYHTAMQSYGGSAGLPQSMGIKLISKGMDIPLAKKKCRLKSDLCQKYARYTFYTYIHH